MRCQEGGLDGVETVTGGHLIGQFLSPRTNQRTDAFGGSTANRARFGLMVHEGIRKAVGDDFLVGIRYVVEEDIEDGIDFEECLKLARLFESAGHIDFFNCIFGRMDTDLALAEHNMPGMSQPIAPFLKPVGAFRRETRLPVFHAARIPDLATARHAIAEGLLDMVAMTRAHMADPQIVNKLARGEEERIRPCVGASYCMYKKVACIHNPASGREQILPQIVERSAVPGRKIVVVGGGPGGLEAARVAAERGHKVVLFEAGARLGGQLLIAVRASWRRDLIAIVDWRTRSSSGSASMSGSTATPRRATFLPKSPTRSSSRPAACRTPNGSTAPSTAPASGTCSPTARGPRRMSSSMTAPGGIRRCPAPCISPRSAATCSSSRSTTTWASRWSIRRASSTASALPSTAFAPRSIISSPACERSGNQLVATFRHELTGTEMELRASQVVIEHGTVPVDELFNALRGSSVNDGITDLSPLLAGRPQLAAPPQAGAFELHRIGDAVTSRNVHGAIYDALRLCMAL